jgi:hypothetical protein
LRAVTLGYISECADGGGLVHGAQVTTMWSGPSAPGWRLRGWPERRADVLAHRLCGATGGSRFRGLATGSEHMERPLCLAHGSPQRGYRGAIDTIRAGPG